MSTQDKKTEVKALEDNLVVVPTPEYVKDSIKSAIEEHAQSRNHPYATLEDRGFVTLSNDVSSDSETHAATSKAVKVAYDLANTANQNAIKNNANFLEKKQNGADVPDKAEFVKNLGLRETVELAKNSVPNSRKINGRALTNDVSLNAADIGAMNATSLGTIGNGSRFSDYVLSGFYNVTVSNPSSVPDFPLLSAGYLYGDGILEALNGGNVIFQRYTSHHGQEAVRQSWDKGNTWGGWVSQLVRSSTLLETEGWIQDHNTGVITAWTTGEIATAELSMQVPLPITFPTGILNVQVSTKVPKYDVYADGFWQVIDWDKASVTVELQLVATGAYNRQYRPMIYVVGY